MGWIQLSEKLFLDLCHMWGREVNEIEIRVKWIFSFIWFSDDDDDDDGNVRKGWKWWKERKKEKKNVCL